MNLPLAAIVCIASAACGASIFWHSWRGPLFALFAYISISGFVSEKILGIRLGSIATDVVFVVPCYIALLLSIRKRRKFPGIPLTFLVLVIAFSFIVVLQILNMHAQSATILERIIGAKLWLLNIPLFFIGYFLFGNFGYLRKFFRLITCCAWLPCIIAIFQWAISLGYKPEEFITLLYPDLLAAKKASLPHLIFPGGTGAHSVKSTFLVPAQYSAFLINTLISISLHRTIECNIRWTRFADITLALVSAAAILTGSPELWFITPSVLICLALSHRRYLPSLRSVHLALLTCLVLTIATFRLSQVTTATDNPAGAFLLLREEESGMINLPPLNSPYLGTGTGSYSWLEIGNHQSIWHLSRLWSESYFEKALKELGWVGLFLILALIVYPILVCSKCYYRLGPTEMKAFAGSLVVFFVLTAIGSFSSPYLDIEPNSLFFWTFLGMLFHINAYRTLRFGHVRCVKPTELLIQTPSS